MSGDPKLDQDMTRAVTTLSDALADVFKAGGQLDGYGFALWIIPKGAAAGIAPLISNTPRPRVAEVVAAWMLEHGFAMAVQIPPPPKSTQKPN